MDERHSQSRPPPMADGARRGDDPSRTGILSPPGPPPASAWLCCHAPQEFVALRRIASASLLSLLILAVGASSAIAHECFNASRSAQGDTGAQHSENWFNLSLEFVFTVSKGELTPGFDKHGADGRGIDHGVDAYGDQIFGIFFAASELP